MDTVPIWQVSSEFTQEIEDCAVAESLLRYLTKLQTYWVIMVAVVGMEEVGI